MPPELKLLAMARGLYSALLPALPQRGHCIEASAILSALASALGIEHRRCTGSHRQANGDAMIHSWIEVGDSVLHSPQPGLIVAQPRDDRFETSNAITITPEL